MARVCGAEGASEAAPGGEAVKEAKKKRQNVRVYPAWRVAMPENSIALLFHGGIYAAANKERLCSGGCFLLLGGARRFGFFCVLEMWW